MVQIESLEEERIKLKEKIRKLAKIAGSKANVAALIEDETDATTKPKDLISTKLLQELDTKLNVIFFCYICLNFEIIFNKIQQIANQTVKQSAVDVEELKQKNEHLLNLQKENEHLEEAFKELQNTIKNVKPKAGKGGEVLIQCPSLDKLLQV